LFSPKRIWNRKVLAAGALLIAGILAGIYVTAVWDQDEPAEPPRLPAEATGGAADALRANATLARAMDGRRIVNAHEHIQSAREAGKLTAVMDELGVGRTLLFGSSWFTITLNPKAGFTRYDQNNAAIMGIYKADPGRFEPWPTIDPRDPDKLAKIRRLVA
jgi:hypothetical protein